MYQLKLSPLRDSPTLGKTVAPSYGATFGRKLPHYAPSLVLPYLPYVRSVCSGLPASAASITEVRLMIGRLHAVRNHEVSTAESKI